jgi:8-oxo-dGTP diphosphatase
MPNTVPKKRVHVAVGVISDGAKNILVARRAEYLHQGGLWEFPGGKVESGESVRDALQRELVEELAIHVVASEPLLTIAHDYHDKAVLLDVWWVSSFQGEPHGREGQPLRWVDVRELKLLDFPAANVPIIAAVEQKLLLNNSSTN